MPAQKYLLTARHFESLPTGTCDLLARFIDNGLFASSRRQRGTGVSSPYAHGLDQGHLVVTEHLDERQRQPIQRIRPHEGQAHTRNGKHVVYLFRGARHHRGQRAVQQVECRVADRRAEVVGDERYALPSPKNRRYRIDEDDGNCECAHPENRLGAPLRNSCARES